MNRNTELNRNTDATREPTGDPDPSRDRQGAAPPDTTKPPAPATSAGHPPGDPPPRRPAAYLITFTAYGTWLHGRAAGSVERGRNIPGTAYLGGDESREQAEFQRLKHSPVYFNAARRKVIEQTIREVCSHRGSILHEVHVRTNHVHVVVTAQATPERVMNDLKSYATRRMVEAAVFPAGTRAWTRHGSTRYLWNAKALHDACVYVRDRQGAKLGQTNTDETGVSVEFPKEDDDD